MTETTRVTASDGGRVRDPAADAHRWLGWFALAAIIGMHAGTLFKPLGNLGETRVADWIDLLTPFAVVGTAALVISARPNRVAWWTFFVGAVAFTLGHGMHLSANSISNVADDRVARADIVKLWDEVASHYVWYAGMYLIMVAIVVAVRQITMPLSVWDRVVATLFAITLFDTYIEGAVPWMGLCFLASGLVAAWVWRPSTVSRLVGWVAVVGLILMLAWGVGWYIADGKVFPEFSEVGWI